MIDYDKPDDDPIVAKVRCAREEIFAEYNFDVDFMFKEMEKRQATDGRKYSTLQPCKPFTQESEQE